MGVKSTVDLLPEEARNKLNELLRTPAFTQKQVADIMNAFLVDIAEEPVMSQRIINRYAAKMDKVGNRLQQSRQVAEMWIGKLGAEPQGQVGQLLNEVVRNLAFDTALKLSESEGEEPVHPKLIKDLAKAISDLEKAASDNEKRSAEIRRKAREEAAAQATATAKAAGVSEATIDRIRRDVLGMAG